VTVVARHILVALTDPVGGADETFNHWYDEIHLPEVLAVPRFVAAHRYRLAETVTGDGLPRYLAVYEIEADDASAAIAALKSATPAMDMGDSLDPSSTIACLYTSIGPSRTEASRTLQGSSHE